MLSFLVKFMSPCACGDDLQEDFLCIIAKFLEIVSVVIVLSYVDFMHGPVYELVSVVEAEDLHHFGIQDLV